MLVDKNLPFVFNCGSAAVVFKGRRQMRERKQIAIELAGVKGWAVNEKRPLEGMKRLKGGGQIVSDDQEEAVPATSLWGAMC